MKFLISFSKQKLTSTIAVKKLNRKLVLLTIIEQKDLGSAGFTK